MENLDNIKLRISNKNVDENEYIESVGRFIDLAASLNKIQEIDFAIEHLNDNNSKITIKENLCLFHYFLSIAYSDKHKIEIAQTEKDWDWEQEIIANEITHLRLAYSFCTEKTDNRIISSILTNLANRLNNLGRFILALDFWNEAYKIDNETGMPLINKANNLMLYALNYLSQPKYQVAYIQLAHQYFIAGLNKFVYDEYKADVLARLNAIETNYAQYLDYKFYRDDFEETTENSEYLKWCIEKELCLNPLSNIDVRLSSSKDDIILKESSNTSFVNLFENIKQDYIFARFEFYQSFNSKFSKQQKKSSFSNTYAIFDKLGYLINGIFQLNLKNDRVTFSRIWFTNLDKNKGLSTVFTESRNLMLRALYWVSKDIYLNEDGFKNLIEPKAKEINTIRNFIEHKSFDFGERTEDNFTLHIPENEFDECMFKLLRLVRESIIYIACATNVTTK